MDGKPNIVLVTVLEEFRQSGKTLYFPFDGHMTVEGHELVGSILNEKIMEELGVVK